jgi:hypothetical protein
VKIYVAAVEGAQERGNETQFTTKIGWKPSIRILFWLWNCCAL